MLFAGRAEQEMDVMTKTADYHKKYVAQRLVEGKDLANCTQLIFSVIIEEEGKVGNVLLRQTLPKRSYNALNKLNTFVALYGDGWRQHIGTAVALCI